MVTPLFFCAAISLSASATVVTIGFSRKRSRPSLGDGRCLLGMEGMRGGDVDDIEFAPAFREHPAIILEALWFGCA